MKEENILYSEKAEISLSFSSPVGNWERILMNLSENNKRKRKALPISGVKEAFRVFKELKYKTAKSYAEIVYR